MSKMIPPGWVARKNGRYYIILYLHRDTGEPIQKWVATGMKTAGSLRKAERMLSRLQNGVAEGTINLGEDGKLHGLEAVPEDQRTATGFHKLLGGKPILLSDLLEAWLEHVKLKLEETTFAGYRNTIESTLVPYFAKRKMSAQKLSPEDLEEFYSDCLLTRSANTVIHYHALIRQALKFGMRRGILYRNVADLVEKPRKEPYLADYYNEEEMKELLEKVKGNPLEFAVRMACIYGLRREEVAGLRWEAIDFVYHRMQIRHTVTNANINGRYCTIRKDRAKTMRSLRMLPLTPKTEEYLKALKEEEDKAGRGDGYVYLREDGRGVDPGWITQKFSEFLKLNGFRHIRFHDLRHSCASLLRYEGVPMEDIQRWLGHSSIVTTESVYVHFDDGQNRISAAKLASALLE
jgi:integrase